MILSSQLFLITIGFNYRDELKSFCICVSLFLFAPGASVNSLLCDIVGVYIENYKKLTIK